MSDFAPDAEKVPTHTLVVWVMGIPFLVVAWVWYSPFLRSLRMLMQSIVVLPEPAQVMTSLFPSCSTAGCSSVRSYPSRFSVSNISFSWFFGRY